MTISSPQQSSTADGSGRDVRSVSVVVAAYTEHRWPDTVEAISSVCRQSFRPLEVILVIDHNPALLQRARTELRGVTILENVGPKGASGARNTGVANSSGEILVFLDDDAVATPGWLGALCRHFDVANVVGVGGGLTPAWPGTRPRWFPREFDWVVGGSYTGMPDTVAPIRNVWTGNMAVRRSAFEAAQGFRPGFGKTGRVSRPEDTDLCLRVRRAVPGGHWMYDPMAEVAHKVPPERSTPVFFLTRCWNEGRGKAALARLVGMDDSTASERRYATRVLPRAFFRQLSQAILRGDVGSLQRSAAIVGGLSLTIAGLIAEILFGRRHCDPRSDFVDGDEPYRPVRVAEWETTSAFAVLPQGQPGHGGGERVRLLVRLGTEPLGVIEFESERTGSTAAAAEVAVWESFGSMINARLTGAGIPPVDKIPAEGLAIDGNRLEFVVERERFLADAPEVSVVLCTRNRPARLTQCVRQLAEQEYPRYEIVVVDNAPDDPGAAPGALASLNLSVPVQYLVESRAGLSWARNTGWRAAAGDIVAFLDDDEVPDRFWLAELVRGFLATTHVGCVTGMVLPAELRTEPQHWFEQFGGHSKGRGFSQAMFGPDHPQSPLYPLPAFGSGANMAFRRDVLYDVGGFHVALGAGTPAKGAEDTFAFTRVLLRRHTLVYQPTALTWHYHRETIADLEEQLHGYGIGLTAYYAALLSSDPKLLVPMLRLIPAAIRDLRGIDSVRTATIGDFPVSVLRSEVKGMLKGVPEFVRSVREQRDKAVRPHHSATP